MGIDSKPSIQAFCCLANLQGANPKGVEYNNASCWSREFTPPPEDINLAGDFLWWLEPHRS